MVFLCWAFVARPATAESSPTKAAHDEGSQQLSTAPVSEGSNLDSTNQRRARYRTRYAVGGDIGYADLPASEGPGMGVHVGIRKQIAGVFGAHIQILTLVADDSKNIEQRIQITRYEFGGTVVPYFGPVGRIYLGPLLYAGYRYYHSNVQIESLSTGPFQLPKSGTFLQWGWRLGVLVGPKEQVDISSFFSTSLDNSAFLNLNFMLGASFEFR